MKWTAMIWGFWDKSYSGHMNMKYWHSSLSTRQVFPNLFSVIGIVVEIGEKKRNRGSEQAG